MTLTNNLQARGALRMRAQASLVRPAIPACSPATPRTMRRLAAEGQAEGQIQCSLAQAGHAGGRISIVACFFRAAFPMLTSVAAGRFHDDGSTEYLKKELTSGPRKQHYVRYRTHLVEHIIPCQFG